MRRPLDTAGENPHLGMVSDVEASHEGFSFGLDVSAQFDNPPAGRRCHAKPASPFETLMPASVDSPYSDLGPAAQPGTCGCRPRPAPEPAPRARRRNSGGCGQGISDSFPLASATDAVRETGELQIGAYAATSGAIGRFAVRCGRQSAFSTFRRSALSSESASWQTRRGSRESRSLVQDSRSRAAPCHVRAAPDPALAQDTQMTGDAWSRRCRKCVAISPAAIVGRSRSSVRISRRVGSAIAVARLYCSMTARSALRCLLSQPSS